MADRRRRQMQLIRCARETQVPPRRFERLQGSRARNMGHHHLQMKLSDAVKTSRF
jgi:hypothetical protein